jgi:hypothetical protein
MPIDSEFPKNHKVKGNINMKMVDFTLYGVLKDLMRKLHLMNRYKKLTNPEEEKNMFP